MDTFLNALKAVSITFSQHIVKLFHRANRSFISQPLLPTQGPWVDPGKKEDFGNLSSGGGEVFNWCLKKDSVKPDPVLSQAPLSFPSPALALRFAFPQDLAWKGSSGEVCGVTASGVGTVSAKEWTRCSRAEDTDDAPQQLQKALAGAGPGLCPRTAVSWSSWKSMLQPNQLPSSSPCFRAVPSSFLQWKVLPPLCLAAVLHHVWAGNQEIKQLQVKN